MSRKVVNKGGHGVGTPYDFPAYEYDPVNDSFKDLETGKTFTKDGNAKLEANKAFTVTANGVTLVTPSPTYDGMEKVTLDVQVPSSGGASIPLYAWKSNSDDTIAYTLTPNPKIEESAFYDFDLTTKVAKPENEFGINDTDESGYITYDEWTFQRDSTLDTIVSGPAYIALNSGSILPAGQKVYMCALDTSTYSTFTVFCPDTDGTSSVSDLFSNAGAEGAPSYAGTIGNIHFFFPYTG